MRKMKDSGIVSIEAIPSSWGVIKLNFLKDENNPYPIGDGDHGSIKPEHYIDSGIPYIRVQNLTWTGELFLDDVVYISEETNELNKKSILFPGDILVAKTGATIGKTALIPDSVPCANTTSSVGKVTISPKFSNKYYFYVLGSEVCLKQMWDCASQKSAQPGFNIDDLIAFKVPFPSVEEQHSIATFLDKKCGEIDRVISDTQRTIEEYKALKQAIITEAVTKGIRKGRPMKDSGIEWIGEIPEEWNMWKHKHLFSYKKEIVGENSSVTQLLSLTTKGVKVKSADTLGGKLPESFDTYQYVKKNDLIMCLFDLDCSAVFSGLSPFDGMVSPAYKIIKCKKNLNSNFADYWFRFVFEGRKFKTYAKNLRYTLSFEEFAMLYMAVPSLMEQQEIADYLDKKCAEIDKLIASKERLLAELEEYKKSVIYEYVTGKKEVVS